MKTVKKTLKILKVILFGYALVAAVTATGLLVYAGLEKVTGKALNPWAHSVAEALFESGSENGAAVATTPQAKPAEDTAARTIQDELVLDELRREILHAADEIQLLESSVVDQISRDLSDMDRRREAQASRVLTPFADFLNLVLVGDDEWNVDLAKQFTELLVGQRAFQANARTMTMADTLLQELVNLI